MSTAALGSRSAAVDAAVELRLRDLERTVGRVASRTLNGSPGYHSKRISATTAGWAVGTWVQLSGGTWTTAATSSTFAPDAIGVVLLVIDATTAEIVTGGFVQLLGTAYTASTRYYLSTSAGVATSTAPVAPNVRQPLFVAYQDGWIDVDGPAGASPRSLTLAGLRDVTITTPTDGQLFKYDLASGLWINGATSLALLSDVTITTVADLQVLSWSNSAGKWINRTLSAGATTLAGLSDVTITSVADLDFLRYDNGSSKWKNVNLGLIAYDAASASLSLDGGSGAASATKVGIAGANSRFIISQTTNPLDFILSGSVSAGTDISARIRRVSSSQVAFFDQGTATTTAGTSVLEWNVSATAASRSFDFKIPILSVNIGISARYRNIGRNQGITANVDTVVTTITTTAGTPTLTGFNTSTGIFTAPAAGTYQFCACILATNASAVDLVATIYLSKNASTTDIEGKTTANKTNADPFGASSWVSTSGIFDLAASDTVKLVANIFAGTSPTVADVYFSIVRVI